MKNIIEVKGLRKKYGNVYAVGEIDFSVEEGKLFAFLGPNGAGKSTTINMLCTLLEMDHGQVTIDGHDLKKEPDKVRQSIGVVFQESLLDSVLTVRENLMVRAGFYYNSKSQRKEAIERASKAGDVLEVIDRAYDRFGPTDKASYLADCFEFAKGKQYDNLSYNTLHGGSCGSRRCCNYR